MSNANPSLNPADNDSLTGTFRHVFSKMMQQIDGVLPAQIIAYDRTNNLAQVQPLISVVTTDGAQINRSQIASIPVYQIGGGGFTLNFNLLPGDQGLIVACDRDISLYMQTGSESPPNTNFIKDFGNSFFLPMLIRNFTIASEDSEHAVFQNADGTTRISLWPDKIKMTATAVEINGNLIVDGNITLINEGLMEGNIEIDGTLKVSERAIFLSDVASGGDITAAGTITPGVPIPP